MVTEMVPLLAAIDEAARPEVLGVALSTVLARAASKSRLSRAMREHAIDPTALIERLAEELADRSYSPGPLRSVMIHERGSRRELHLPSIADRVAETALSTVLARRVDPLLSPLSVAYRRGTSTAHASLLAQESRDEGQRFAVRADITACFDEIPHDLVLSQLRRLGIDTDTVEIVSALLARGIVPSSADHHPALASARGIPQGAPLSPLLSNIALDDLDHRAAARGLILIRYSDDLLVPVESRAQAREARRALTAELGEMGLSVRPEKVETMSFAAGFTFVGQEIDCGSDRTRAARARETHAREKGTIYLGKTGTTAVARNGRVQVLGSGGVALDVPQNHVERIVVFGPVGLSGGLRQWALNSGIELVFLSARGKLLGTAGAGHSRQVRLRMRQYDVMRKEGFAARLGAAFIRGKLANSRALLRRHASKGTPQIVAAAIDDHQHAFASALGAKRKSLMGIEGMAARSYWEAYATMVPPGLVFTTRRRRPSPDPVNAALSLLSVLLTGEAVGALAAVGLDPAVGPLHRPRDSRPSLALDLIEEFRPLIVETTVLEMARRNMLAWEATETHANGGVKFTADTMRVLFRRYEARMTTVFNHVPSGTRCSYRRALHLQAQSIARCVRTGSVSYEATAWRV